MPPSDGNRLPICRGGDRDQHLVVFHESGFQYYEMYNVPYPYEAVLSVANAKRNDARDYGWESLNTNSWGGTTAAGASVIGGSIRKGESARIGGIQHALAALVHYRALNRNGPGGHSYVWPANRSDDPSGYGTSGNLFMGSLLAIPPTVDITKLGITNRYALEIVRAMQDYGIYIVDTSPWWEFIGEVTDGIKLKVEQWNAASWDWNATMYPAIASSHRAVLDDVKKALPYLMVVANNSPTTVGGGGTPRRPPASPYPPR